MHQCPHCRSTERQVKSGFNRTGSQRLQCQSCHRQYTPVPNPLGYDDKTREAALKLYLEGNGFRRIGRLLSVNHQSVANWVNSAHARLKARQPPAPEPETAGTLEMDELFTFVGAKKSPRISSPSSSARRAESSLTRSARSGRRK
jgi:transposase-like protein